MSINEWKDKNIQVLDFHNIYKNIIQLRSKSISNILVQYILNVNRKDNGGNI